MGDFSLSLLSAHRAFCIRLGSKLLRVDCDAIFRCTRSIKLKDQGIIISNPANLNHPTYLCKRDDTLSGIWNNHKVEPDTFSMTSINSFSGHNNRGLQLGFNSGHVNFNVYGPPGKSSMLEKAECYRC